VGRDRVTVRVLDLQPEAAALGQIEDGREIGACPALVLAPGGSRRHRDRGGQVVALPVRQRGHVDGGEHGGEAGEQGDRRQRHAEERERQPGPQRVAALAAARRVKPSRVRPSR